MRLVIAVLACLFATGCAPTLGAHVKKFKVRRVEFVKCTVIVEKADRHFAEESLEVCKDAFGMTHGIAEVEVPK